VTAPVRVAGSAFAATVNWTVPDPWPDEPAVMLTQVTSGCAVHWHSRSVRTSMEAEPPEAGTGVPGASTATAHFDNVDGDVTVLPDEPQDASATAAAKSPAFIAKTAGPRKVRPSRMIPGTAVVAAPEELNPSRYEPKETEEVGDVGTRLRYLCSDSSASATLHGFRVRPRPLSADPNQLRRRPHPSV
jgi:hypothetical protein